jgi:hypothetical protein
MNSLCLQTNRSRSITMTVFASEHLSCVMSATCPLFCPMSCPMSTVLSDVMSDARCSVRCHVRCPLFCPMSCPMPAVLSDVMSAARCSVRCHVRCSVRNPVRALSEILSHPRQESCPARISFAIVVNRTSPVQSKRLMKSLTVSVGQTAGFFIDSAFRISMNAELNPGALARAFIRAPAISTDQSSRRGKIHGRRTWQPLTRLPWGR